MNNYNTAIFDID